MFVIYVDDMHYSSPEDIWGLFKALFQIVLDMRDDQSVRIEIRYTKVV